MNLGLAYAIERAPDPPWLPTKAVSQKQGLKESSSAGCWPSVGKSMGLIPDPANSESHIAFDGYKTLVSFNTYFPVIFHVSVL